MKCKIYLIASLVLINSSWLNIIALPYPGIVNQYNRNINNDPQVIYETYYTYPTRLQQGQEKRETAGKALVPQLAIKKTETIRIPNTRQGRQATKITYDIQQTIDQLQKKPVSLPVDVDAPVEFNIQQRVDNNNNPLFVMQLPKHYLAGGLLDPFSQQWGPWWKEIKDMGDYWEFILNYNEIRPTPSVPAAG